MKYTVTHTCGHTEEVELFGGAAQRDYRISQMENDICPDCQRAASMAEMADEISRGEIGPLKGSDAQTEWAGRIRRQKLQELERCMAEGYAALDAAANAGAITVDAAAAQRAEAQKTERMLSKAMRYGLDKASWWIDRRSLPIAQMLRDVQAYIAEHGAEAETDNAADQSGEIAAQAEATVQPEDKRVAIVAEIAATDEAVTVRAPRCDSLRELLRSRGYRWDERARCWRKEINYTTGRAADRAAEIGNACLLAGIPVRIYDEDVRRRAVAAEYEPECKRWLSLRDSGRYAGWLTVSWERGEQGVYDAARRISGSRWDSPNVVVPIDQYRAVEDFADVMGFRVTPKAAGAIQAYRDNEAGPVAAKEPAPEPVPDSKLSAVLTSSREVLEDLRDDPQN